MTLSEFRKKYVGYDFTGCARDVRVEGNYLTQIVEIVNSDSRIFGYVGMIAYNGGIFFTDTMSTRDNFAEQKAALREFLKVKFVEA